MRVQEVGFGLRVGGLEGRVQGSGCQGLRLWGTG